MHWAFKTPDASEVVVDEAVVFVEIDAEETAAATITAHLLAGRRVIAVIAPTATVDPLVILAAGAAGAVRSDDDREEFHQAFRAATTGRRFVSDGVLSALIADDRDPQRLAPRSPFDELAPREREVVQRLVRGLSNREIAEALGISEGTVKVHLRHVMDKWRVRDRLQVALHAVHRSNRAG